MSVASGLRQVHHYLVVIIGGQLVRHRDVELHTRHIALVLHDDGQGESLAGGTFHRLNTQHVGLCLDYRHEAQQRCH